MSKDDYDETWSVRVNRKRIEREQVQKDDKKLLGELCQILTDGRHGTCPHTKLMNGEITRHIDGNDIFSVTVNAGKIRVTSVEDPRDFTNLIGALEYMADIEARAIG